MEHGGGRGGLQCLKNTIVLKGTGARVVVGQGVVDDPMDVYRSGNYYLPHLRNRGRETVAYPLLLAKAITEI